jgi:YVTN family beta-propeller protein
MGTKVYVTNWDSNSVSVIDTVTNKVIATEPVGKGPNGVAVTPDGSKVYVANSGEYSSGYVSVIDTATDNITANVPVGREPIGVAITPDGSKVYVTNFYSNNVFVIDTSNDNVTATVPVGNSPFGVAVTPYGTAVYVANEGSGSVSVIDTSNDNVTATVPVEGSPSAFGQFIGSPFLITWNNPADIVYGTALSGTQLNAIASVPGNFTYTPSIGTILNIGTQQTLNAIFTPDDTANYAITAANVSINVLNPIRTTPTINWNNPADVVYGTPLNNIQLDATVSDPFSGNTISGSFVYTPEAGTMLNVGQQQTLNTTFTPDDFANYTTVSENVSINITPANPIITWNNPADIVYGTPLSNAQLDATAPLVLSCGGSGGGGGGGLGGDLTRGGGGYRSCSLSSLHGTFVYTPDSGTVLNIGSHQTLNTIFTPTDTRDYNIASVSIPINVLNPIRTTPSITWNNPADIVYGTPLSNAQLDATASVPGTLAYNIPTGTILSAGPQQTLTATFTPTDIANYTTASASVSINVTKETPIITWNNPADIVYGTALSSTQLDAKGSVPGPITYNPQAGTILNAGQQQQLTATLTPNDNVNYTQASANVKINVLDPTQKIVLAPTQKINQMVTFVQGLVTSGELDEGSSYELIAILNSAETNLDRTESNPSVENPFVEPTELRYFISQVRDKINRGVLSPTNGQILIDGAKDIINSLNNQVR